MSAPDGYKSNTAFLALAPDGTSFVFNNESFKWKKHKGEWYTSRDTKRECALEADDGWNGDNWVINNIIYPDPFAPVTRTREQEHKIIVNIERLVEVTAETIESGLPPDQSDLYWMGKIVQAFDLGMEGKGWK